MSPLVRMFLGATLLTAGHGGIARVARMTARTMIDQGTDIELLSLLDEMPVDIADHRATTVRGNRIAYVARCHVAALTRDRFLYDSVGMARAHPRFAPLRRPYGVWIHGIEVWHYLGADRERALRAADLVLVNSQFTLDRFQNLHWPLDAAHVCWLATEDDEAPTARPDFQGPPTVLLLGRIDKDQFYKGHKEVVESWSTVAAAIPDARLVIAGGGSGLAHLRDLARSSSASRSIKILGFVPEADLPALWQQAHVFAMPSRKEGFGLVYIEAMRQGLPVIASVHDAGAEVNVDGQTGYNVNLDKPKELADRLIHLLRSPDLAQSLGQTGHDRWRQHFRFSAFSRRLNAILAPFVA